MNCTNVIAFGKYQNAEEIKSLRPSKIPKAIEIIFGDYSFELEDDPIRWKKHVTTKIENPTAYIQNKMEIMDAVKKRWIEWKSKNRTEFDVIKECDKKLQSTVSIVQLMVETFFKDSIFNSIKSGDLETLNNQFVGLDTIQKSKYFTSTMKFVTSWAKGDEEMTPLQYASHLGNMDAVKFFVESGASVNDFRNTSDSTQRSSLHFAIDGGHIDIALFLISKEAKDKLASSETWHASKQYQLPVEFGGSYSCLSALHMAIIKKWHTVALELLKTGNSNIQEKASGINTPLHLAARNGDEEMVKLLLSFGADKAFNVKNSDRKTPKEMASKHNHDHLLTLLT